MKIGVMPSSFHTSFRRALRLASKVGATGIQPYFRGYTSVEAMTEKRILQVQRLLQKYNLEISAFCGDVGGHGFCDASKNPERIALTKRMIDIAEAMEVHVITTHVGIIPADKTKKTYIALYAAMKELGDYAAEHEVTLAIETGPETAPTLKAFLDDIDSVGVGVNLDPANFVMVTGQDPVEAVRLLGRYIVHTHAKDGKKLRDGDPAEVYGSLEEGTTHAKLVGAPMFTETAFGEGQVDWDAYLDALREIGYTGYLTIERETWQHPYKTIKQAVDFLIAHNTAESKRVVVAVVGCGNIANAAHFPAIAKIPEYKLKYCVDIIPERAERAAQKYGKSGYTQAITDYHQVLEDPEVQAIVVCTHTFLHGKIAIEGMRAGKHVLSEKPVAMTYAEAEEMAKVSEETGMISNVGVCMRFNGGVNAVRRLINAGELGDVYSVYCSFRNYRNIPGIGGEFTNKAHSGGGVLFDWGVHFLDLIMYCIGEPDVLTASAATYSELGSDIEGYKTKGISYSRVKTLDGVYDVEEFVTGFVRTEGASISLNGAWAQNIDKAEMFIDFMGSKAGIRLHYGKNFELFCERDGKLVRLTPSITHGNMYLAEERAFVRDILCGTRSRAYVKNLLPTAKLLDALYTSAEKGEEVQFQGE